MPKDVRPVTTRIDYCSEMSSTYVPHQLSKQQLPPSTVMDDCEIEALEGGGGGNGNRGISFSTRSSSGGGGGGSHSSSSDKSSPNPKREAKKLNRRSTISKLNSVKFIEPKFKEEDGSQRTLYVGVPDTTRCDNTIITAKYNIWTFLPLTVRAEFRKFTNCYFLIVGVIMAFGYNHIGFTTTQSPIGLLAPLALFICISLVLEYINDSKRHKNDRVTNASPCIVLENENASSSSVTGASSATRTSSGSGPPDSRRSSVVTSKDIVVPVSGSSSTSGTDATTKVKFNTIESKDVRQGQLLVLNNRQRIPADMILLASSGDLGCAYIETCSIDGETNLKLRTTAKATATSNQQLRLFSTSNTLFSDSERSSSERSEAAANPNNADNPAAAAATAAPTKKLKETLEEAIQRLSAFTSLGCINDEDKENQVAVLRTEAPNAHIDTFTGNLKYPTSSLFGGSGGTTVPLDADHLLPRAAVLRNTEWAIGVVVFTGNDTKLSQNSVEAPTKFSQLDRFTNRYVLFSLAMEMVCVVACATKAVNAVNYTMSDTNGQGLWYLGMYRLYGETESYPKWPYLANLDTPDWERKSENWIQAALAFVTLFCFFVPLSMIVTVQMVNAFMLYLVYADVDMYDDTTDIRAEPRSTIVTDLGQIQYIFSDKTGTLTQNVMRFKRCSIDGMVYGSPIQKSRPKRKSRQSANNDGGDGDNKNDMRKSRADDDRPTHDFSPIRHTLGLGDKSMTFNAELFIRVMSLCHTVAVEKDIDSPVDEENDSGKGEGILKSLIKSSTKNDNNNGVDLEAQQEEQHPEQGPDGAPFGFAYQAESPDEGALVSEASRTFGFQVLYRDVSGIKLKCHHPTLFRNSKLINDLKSGKLDPMKVAADSVKEDGGIRGNDSIISTGDGIETWSVLAINKFDSTRKRMSILLRSPPEFGSVPILFCKGADTAMLDPKIRSGGIERICTRISMKVAEGTPLDVVGEEDCEDDDDEDDDGDEKTEYDVATTLGIQAHLGEFASEGLRTLVLGVRFMKEDECSAWMKMYTAATTALKDREKKVKAAAAEIERGLHIVGATAIEDKLQVGVASTIACLENAGIKLWVLTGDKRETAVEIGYATKVLTPDMRLTEIADRGSNYVIAQCAMEFLRLVKSGKLPAYQRAALVESEQTNWFKETLHIVLRTVGVFFFTIRRFFLHIKIIVRGLIGMDRAVQQQQLEDMYLDRKKKKEMPSEFELRQNVRNRAETIVKNFMRTSSKHLSQEVSTPDALPKVFALARSSKNLLNMHQSQQDLGHRSSLIQLAAQDELLFSGKKEEILKEEPLSKAEQAQTESWDDSDDVLDQISVVPCKEKEDDSWPYDEGKRTLLERLFAVDKDVQQGILVKHLKNEHDMEALGSSEFHNSRALVIEGAALKYCQDDIELEEMFFNIASQCEAVIACRVTPRQKAQLVKLVRHHVVPEPVTLAIGDGANDVGMIHEAHVGIGISGKEGQQAVNASDFSIGQFRFLESLILYHGRWDYLRMSIVVLFSFYKNLVLVGTIILYLTSTLYSQTILYDQWVMNMFNFVIFFSIFFIGMFDRDHEKAYVKKNPEVYKATQEQENIRPRNILRWVVMALIHCNVLYWLQIHSLAQNGGNTSAFKGFMRNKANIGDGQVNDWQSVGTTMFSTLVVMLSMKILYETRSIINGKWPTACLSIFKSTIDSEDGGFLSRLPWTWYGIFFGQFVFYILFLYVYAQFGIWIGPECGSFYYFLRVPEHVLGTSLMNYITMLFIPIAGISVDVLGKGFSNMFYPTQNQIHMELEVKEAQQKKAKTE